MKAHTRRDGSEILIGDRSLAHHSKKTSRERRKHRRAETLQKSSGGMNPKGGKMQFSVLVTASMVRSMDTGGDQWREAEGTKSVDTNTALSENLPENEEAVPKYSATSD